MRWIILFSLLLGSNLLLGQEAGIDAGAALLKNGEWKSAIEFYDGVLESGQASGELHYNMGVAHAELGDMGYAIWHFELAKKWGLDTEALHHNLQLVREERIDEIEEIPEFFLSKWWNTWQGLLSSNLWSIISMLSLLIGIYGLYFWRTAGERTLRKKGFIGGIACSCIAILCLISAISAAKHFEKPSTGVLLSEMSNLRAAPDVQSAPILELHAGADIDVQDQIGDWIKVRLANGQEGWLPLVEVGLF